MSPIASFVKVVSAVCCFPAEKARSISRYTLWRTTKYCCCVGSGAAANPACAWLRCRRAIQHIASLLKGHCCRSHLLHLWIRGHVKNISAEIHSLRGHSVLCWDGDSEGTNVVYSSGSSLHIIFVPFQPLKLSIFLWLIMFPLQRTAPFHFGIGATGFCPYFNGIGHSRDPTNWNASKLPLAVLPCHRGDRLWCKPKTGEGLPRSILWSGFRVTRMPWLSKSMTLLRLRIVVCMRSSSTRAEMSVEGYPACTRHVQRSTSEENSSHHGRHALLHALFRGAYLCRALFFSSGAKSARPGEQAVVRTGVHGLDEHPAGERTGHQGPGKDGGVSERSEVPGCGHAEGGEFAEKSTSTSTNRVRGGSCFGGTANGARRK